MKANIEVLIQGRVLTDQVGAISITATMTTCVAKMFLVVTLIGRWIDLFFMAKSILTIKAAIHIGIVVVVQVQGLECGGGTLEVGERGLLLK